MTTPSVTSLLRLTFIAAICCGCASEPATVTPLPTSTDISSEFARIEDDIAQGAGANDVDVLAPKHYAMAQRALAEAARLRAENQDAQQDSHAELLKRLSQASSYLRYADERASQARRLLIDPRAARANAIDADAGERLPEALYQVDLKLLEQARSIEEGTDSVPNEDAEALVRSYRDIALRSARQVFMEGPVRSLTQAVVDGAEQAAPDALKSTRETVSNLDSLFRSSNPDVTQILARLDASTEETEDLLTLVHWWDVPINQLQGQVSPDEAELVREDAGLVIRLSSLFDATSTSISQEHLDVMMKVTAAIAAIGKPVKVRVLDFTDSPGSTDADHFLSTRRARAVRDFLLAHAEAIGVDNIEYDGMGNPEPILDDSTPEGRALNPRVEIILSRI